jgi:AcrR family transcriptional regulator
MPRPTKAREPLRQAALERFVELGIHGAGIREIARHAGCSEAALYRHWTSKEELVRSLFVEHLAEVVTALDDAIASDRTLPGQVAAACRACYRLYDEQPLVFRFVLLVQHELAHLLPPGLRMPQDVVADLVRAAIARGEARGDPVLLSAALVGVFLQTAVYVLYGRLPGPLSQHVEAVTAAALRVLDAGARARA